MSVPARQTQQQPSLAEFVNPAIGEMRDAIHALHEHLVDIDTAVRSGRAAGAALCAEEIARSANQVKGLAEAIHRGIAKRQGLEARV